MSGKKKTKWYYLIVVQFDDTMKKRDPRKPHVYVDYCLSSPEVRFQQLRNGAGPRYAVGHFTKLLNLVPYKTPAKTIEVAKRRKNELIEKLSAAGHAVNGNAKEWRVYVIDLKQDHLVKKSPKGHIYVGFTSKSIDERVNQHKYGAKSTKDQRLNSKYVTAHFVGLNKKLTPKPFYVEQHAKDREGTLAKELAKKGYLVRAGDKTPKN